jgi:hypothetical protein
MSIFVNAIVGAVCALVAFVIVFWATRNADRDSSARSWGTVILFVVLFTVAKATVIADITGRLEQKDFESKLAQIPAFVAIRKHAPATYGELLAEFQRGRKEGLRDDQLVAAMKPKVMAVAMKSLPVTSNEAASAYMGVMVQEMRELRAQGNGLCYGFMFPQPGAPVNMVKYVKKETVEADLQALAKVIESAALAPQARPTEQEMTGSIQRVFMQLAAKYGADVALYENLGAPGLDKEKVCDMTIDLYDEVLKLPSPENGRVVRFMLAQA